jgi:CDK inhibitor PHO81
VPSVVDGIRSAELIVGVLGSPDEFGQLKSAESDSHAVDAYFDRGTMSFIDRPARDM